MIELRWRIRTNEPTNRGGEPRRPANACAFSGCSTPKDRVVFERWPLCKPHADAVEGSS